MKKHFLLLLSFVVLLWGCEPTKKVIGENPEIVAKSVPTIAVEGGTVEIHYIVENPITGESIVATSSDAWIGSDFTYSIDSESGPFEGVISFTVAANTTDADLTGEVTLSYKNAESVVVALTQSYVENMVYNVANADDPTVNTLTQAIKDKFGEDFQTESIVVMGSMNNADFASLLPFENIDLTSVDVVGAIIDQGNPSTPIYDAIPSFAFLDMSSGSPAPNQTLKTLYLPNEVTSMGAGAIGICMALETVRLPDNLTKIPSQGFYGNMSLKNIVSWGKVEAIEVKAFSTCAALSELNLPSTLTTLGAEAFAACTSLTEVVLPESMETIVGNVFGGCTGLSSFSAPETLDFSNAYACFYHTALTNFYINSATKKLPSQFLMSTKLATLDIPATVEEVAWDFEGAREVGVFADIQTLTEITVHWTENIPVIQALFDNPDTYNIPNSKFLGTFPETFGAEAVVGADLAQYSITIPAGTMDDYLAVDGWDSYSLVEAAE